MNTDYICDDRNTTIPKEIENMSDEEVEKEFKKRFGFLNNKRSDKNNQAP